MPIDAVRLHFDPAAIATLNAVLGVLMFGMALELRPADFRRVLRAPRAPLIGLATQFFLLPALGFLVASALPVAPSVRLGILLVCACPGGNVSNFMTALAGGRLATSVGMTAVSSLASLVMLPLNLQLWAGLSPDTAALVREVGLAPGAMLWTLVGVVGLPVVAGTVLGTRFPALERRSRRPLRILTIGFFGVFVLAAFAKNQGPFEQVIGTVFAPVALVNLGALLLGNLTARLGRLHPADRRAVTLEVGIQNSGLGLVLVFDAFDGLGGMAAVCGWWGIWHIVAGLALALVWSRRPVATAAEGIG